MGPLDAVTDRIAAVLFSARGADGSLGSLAQREAIPARSFRRAYVPLDDPRFDGSVFDRSVLLRWGSMADEGGVRNVLDPDRIETHELELQIGYVFGEKLGSLALLLAGESATRAVSDPRRRAHNDVTAITNALACGDLVQGGLVGVEIVSIARPALAVDELAEGRVLARATFSVVLCVSNNQAWSP
jgi:hypothetical protein